MPLLTGWGGSRSLVWRLLSQSLAAGLTVDVIVCDSGIALVLAFGLRERDIFELRLGVEGDDVPGVQKAGKITQHAEEDVDDRVGTADARFYPNCDGDQYNASNPVSRRRSQIPAIGGKNMARKPSMQSEPQPMTSGMDEVVDLEKGCLMRLRGLPGRISRSMMLAPLS